MNNLPEGLVEWGVRVSQKIEWLIWPPPLNLSAGAKLMIVAVSSIKGTTILIINQYS